MIFAVRCGDHSDFVGVYIAVADCRGRGCGYRIRRLALQDLRGHNVGLTGLSPGRAKNRVFPG
jgi:hypothetical protein